MKYPSETNKMSMRKIMINTLMVIAMTLVSVTSGLSQSEFPDPMNPPRLVNDFTSFLSQNEILSLEKKLRQFNNETSTQIYTVVVNDLAGYAPSDYATRLGEKWGIGQKGKDNGILILVKPKTNNSKGEVFVSVGYGLEGVVPDAVANRIVDNEIIPSFKQGAYYQGLSKATDVLMSLTRGEFTADQYYKQTSSPKRGRSPIGIIFFLLIISSIFGGRSRMGRHSSVGRNLPFWLLLGMMGSGSRSHGGMFGDFSSGSGGFGGFGGGGGGSFGGGGAGGSW